MKKINFNSEKISNDIAIDIDVYKEMRWTNMVNILINNIVTEFMKDLSVKSHESDELSRAFSGINTRESLIKEMMYDEISSDEPEVECSINGTLTLVKRTTEEYVIFYIRMVSVEVEEI